ncbi:Acetamidase/Formamidase [Pluteus cervinus]|uniref:Acetamidase/Formamidase n=1 Tax=Pluteus cervinus TaxID=181527 RepID=A0ACD3B234_9AGAR|nr:Acetamidase/Formamidase [Pluteus cervinus]
MSIHSVKRSQCHLAWDNSIPPVLTVESGSLVSVSCLDASNGQINSTSAVSAISSLVFSQLDQVNGPIYITSALPGDTLQIDVISIEPADWGWTGLIPGFGLLADDEEFKDPHLRIWKLDKERGVAVFDETKGIKVPLRPFAGEMGVAPGEKGAFSTIPPYKTGGNLDTKYLEAGATLFLPIEVEGALFSIGDGHAAQGDGEVCGTAIETPMEVTIRLTVRKDRPYTTTPHFYTSPKVKRISPTSDSNSGTDQLQAEEQYYGTTGVGPDPREAAREATRNMITYLNVQHGIDRVDAYMLCSVAGDLRMHEVVDMPNYVVGMMLPKSVFPSI